MSGELRLDREIDILDVYRVSVERDIGWGLVYKEVKKCRNVTMLQIFLCVCFFEGEGKKMDHLGIK